MVLSRQWNPRLQCLIMYFTVSAIFFLSVVNCCFIRLKVVQVTVLSRQWNQRLQCLWMTMQKSVLLVRMVLSCTVKHFLFARTLFSRKFARAQIRENKVLANNFLC